MGLLARHRRIWLAAALPFLWLPMIVGFISPTPRTPDDAPVEWPRSVSEWPVFPRAADLWMEESFGFRAALLRINAELRYALRSPTTDRIVFGRSDWLFLTDDAVFQQSMGERMRVPLVTALADVAAALQHELKTWGGKLVVAVPPNSQTINREALPAWARVSPSRTEYDLLADLLKARDVPFADLRSALREAKTHEEVYFHNDTHWNNHGVLVGFNAIMRAAGRSDWEVDPAQVEAGFVTVHGAEIGKASGDDPGVTLDLARMIGVGDRVDDRQMKIDLAPLHPAPFTLENLHDRKPMASYVATREGEGPTVMVIGDSFTRSEFLDLIMLKAKRLIWTHHDQCAFDWGLVERWKPDLVILAPTERYVLCAPGRVPRNMPEGPDRTLLKEDAARSLKN